MNFVADLCYLAGAYVFISSPHMLLLKHIWIWDKGIKWSKDSCTIYKFSSLLVALAEMLTLFLLSRKQYLCRRWLMFVKQRQLPFFLMPLKLLLVVKGYGIYRCLKFLCLYIIKSLGFMLCYFQHFFGSFLSRDEAFRIIVDGWEQHVSDARLLLERQVSRLVSSWPHGNFNLLMWSSTVEW